MDKLNNVPASKEDIDSGRKYAELLQKSRLDATLHKLFSTALISYSEGFAAALRCQETAKSKEGATT